VSCSNRRPAGSIHTDTVASYAIVSLFELSYKLEEAPLLGLARGKKSKGL